VGVVSAPARKPRRSRLALVALLLLLGLAGMEGGVRLRQWVRHGTLATSLYDFEVDPVSGLRVPRPGLRRGADVEIEVNELGFRGPPLAMPKPDGGLRLAFLGGSTTFCAEASDNEATWPHLVWEGLQREAEPLVVDYVNASAGGFTVANSRVNLEYRVKATEPDVIVIYHATNDLAIGSRAEAVARHLVDPHEHQPTWLAEHSLAWQLVEKNVLSWFRSSNAVGQLDDDPTPHAARFREELLGLVRECQAVAPVVVLVTFSHRARADQSPAEQQIACRSSRFYMPYMSVGGVMAGIAAYNDVIRDVAAETGALLVDDEHSIPGDDEHFVDSVHFTDEGCRKQAERILSALPPWPELRKRLVGHD
jgi:lysophospholipase L1-like esterase